MFLFAILIGLYSYIIFFLGISGLLYKPFVGILSVLFILANLVWFLLYLRRRRKVLVSKLKSIINNKFMALLAALFICQAILNFIGILVPELAFDALWYHLTLPKLYLINHSIDHISGGLLYYSVMPKLGEMLYVGALSFGNEITVKGVHFLFGLFASVAIYLFSRKYVSPLFAVIAVVIFYSNLVVAWESTTAYIDLIRTFFEIMALWGFIRWFETKKHTWLYTTAIMVGLAITTKVLALGSLFIFSALIAYVLFINKKSIIEICRKIFFFAVVSLSIPLPWFIFSYTQTGNPLYPFFTSVYSVTPEPINPLTFLVEVWKVFTVAADPISPLYLIMIPLVFVTFSKLRKEIKLIVWYSFMSIIIWYFTPRTGGGRFLLPYLPAFSIIAAAVLELLMKNKKSYGLLLPRLLIGSVVITAFVTIGYRSAASFRYIPVIIGQESKDEFLKENLNFAFGDFYDTDSYFKNNIKQTDRVLLYGFHNLYYIEFPFIDSSWVKKGDRFNFVATQKTELPPRFRNWQLIHLNAKTMVKIYKPPQGLCSDLCVY